MTPFQEQLQDVLQKVLTEKTFSTDAMAAIKKLEQEHLALVTTHETLEKSYMAQGDALIKERSDHNLTVIQFNDFKSREKNLVEREMAVTNIEHQKALLAKDVQHHMERANEIKGVLETVFKNTIVRRNVLGSVPVVTPGYKSYGSEYAPQINQQSISETITDTEE